MPPTIIRSPPSTDDYVPLAEWQSSTPQSFHGGKPVLHYHATGAKAWIPKSQCGSLPFFAADSSTTAPSGPESSSLNGASEDQVEQLVDLFINSESFTIFCQKAESGMSIPYPNITLHAIKNIGSGTEHKYPSVYLQLELSDGGADDESYDTVELTLIPQPAAVATDSSTAGSETTKLFEAISECSNLNPDPAEDGDEDEDEYDKIVFEGDVEEQAIPGLPGVYSGSDADLPPPMPGSSGWITAENVHEFFDQEGNWIGGEEEGVSGELGEGAGRVRGRDEAGSDDGNGHGAQDDDAETKRVRTE